MQRESERQRTERLRRAQEANRDEQEEPGAIPELIRRGLDYAEQGRDAASTGYVRLLEGIDRYLAGEVDIEKENESFLKLRLRGTQEESGEHQTDIRLKAKVDLPNTKQRLRLIVDSDTDEDDSLEDRVRGNSTGERVTSDSAIAGLEFIPTEWGKWKTSTSGGVRLRSSLVPFARFKAEREHRFDNGIRSEFEQEIAWFDDRSWSGSSEWELRRALSDRFELISYSEAEFKDRDDQFEFVQQISVLQALSERSALTYRLGSVGASQPNPRVNSVYVGVNYRRRVHEDWVFLSVIPEINYPRSEDWGAEPSLTMELEVFFGRD